MKIKRLLFCLTLFLLSGLLLMSCAVRPPRPAHSARPPHPVHQPYGDPPGKKAPRPPKHRRPKSPKPPKPRKQKNKRPLPPEERRGPLDRDDAGRPQPPVDAPAPDRTPVPPVPER